MTGRVGYLRCVHWNRRYIVMIVAFRYYTEHTWYTLSMLLPVRLCIYKVDLVKAYFFFDFVYTKSLLHGNTYSVYTKSITVKHALTFTPRSNYYIIAHTNSNDISLVVSPIFHHRIPLHDVYLSRCVKHFINQPLLVHG